MKSHRSLLAWQKAHELTHVVLRLSSKSWKPQCAAVFSQLQKSSLSIQLNIAEGYGFTASPTWRRHLRIAYGSAIESEDLLMVLHEHNVCDPQTGEAAVALCRETQRLLFGLMRRYGALQVTSDK
jgi:four helix bundle protein